jgi:hypothetical protein
MLSPLVETVVTPTDGSVASASSYAGVLDVDVFAGGKTSVQLADGTLLSQSAPSGSFAPGAPMHAGGSIPTAASGAELLTCNACAWDDAVSHTWSVAVQVAQGASDTITAGPLALGVRNAPTGPSVKRFVFRVRH